MKRDLKGARVLITGASQGIGRSLALVAVRRGCRVMAAARSEQLLDELAGEARQFGGLIETVTADVTSPEDRRKMSNAVKMRFGGLDILVNNAGIGASGHFTDSKPETLRAIFETNYFGTVELTRECLPMLTIGHSPAIVNISSVLGRRAWPARSLYSASKFALAGWSEAIRPELARRGIHVLVVNPGLTQTNFSKNMLERRAMLPLDHLRGMSPDAVAERTWDAIRSGNTELTLTPRGKLLVITARVAPWLIDHFAKRTIRKLFKDEITERRRKAVDATMKNG